MKPLGKPSPAMVIALLALFIAVGGTGYAAINLPANSVGAKQLKKNAVTRSKIARKSVNGSKVAPDSLTGANILESSLGRVPSATNSSHASQATSATDSNKFGGQLPSYYLPASTVRRVGPITVRPSAGGNRVTLITLRQFTFRGRCLSTGSAASVLLEIVSSAAHAAYSDLTAVQAGQQFGITNMLAGFPYDLSYVSQTYSGVGVFVPAIGEALSADGHQVFYNLYMGQDVGGKTDDSCVFGGSFAQ